MLPTHFKFVEAFRSLAVGYCYSRIESKEFALARLKRNAPGFSESEYQEACEAAIKVAEAAQSTFSKFKPYDYESIDYQGYCEIVDRIIPNYERHIKTGILNVLVQNSLR